MRKIAITIILAAVVFIAACAPGTYYSNHPTSKEQLQKRMGQPYKVQQNEDGSEMLIYEFRGEGVTYMYYLIEDGMVTRMGTP